MEASVWLEATHGARTGICAKGAWDGSRGILSTGMKDLVFKYEESWNFWRLLSHSAG